MLNRNAEALFWVGRYMERAENHARLIDVHYHIQQDGDLENDEHKWGRVIHTLGAQEEYSKQFDTFNEGDVLSFITLDRGFSNSLYSCIHQARSNLRTMREKLPSELWDILNAFYLWLGEKQAADILMESPYRFYRQIKERAAMFAGAQQSVMLRENEWHFIETGRFLERAENTIRILQAVVFAISADRAMAYPYLQAVLKSVSGYQAFRRYYSDAITIDRIMEFLITSDSFPRSIQFAFHKVEGHLLHIDSSIAQYDVLQERPVRKAGRVKANLACLEREYLALNQVGGLLDGLMSSCDNIGRSIEKTFFRFEEATA